MLVTQLCPTLCDPMGCSPPGSSVHGGSPGKNTGVGCHALIQGSSQPRDRNQISHTAGGFFTIWATREAYNEVYFGGKQLIEIIYLWFKFRICSEVSNTFVSHVICFGKDWGYRSLIKKKYKKLFRPSDAADEGTDMSVNESRNATDESRRRRLIAHLAEHILFSK